MLTTTTNISQEPWHDMEAYPSDEVHIPIWSLYQDYLEKNKPWMDDQETYLLTYEGIDNTRKSTVGSLNQIFRAFTPKYSWNVCQSITDTLVSRVGKNRPKPMYIPKGGDYSLKERVETMTDLVNGQFQNAGLYGTGREVFRDACIYGTGVIKTYEQDGKIVHERTLPFEILVDPMDGRYGTPSQLIQRKHVRKCTLKAQYPSQELDIESSSIASTDLLIGIQNQDTVSSHDWVEVVEIWKLPSIKDGKDGRHSIIIQNTTLLDEPWERDDFPFRFLRYIKRSIGFWGVGVVEILFGLQMEINKTIRKVQRSLDLVSVPTWLVDKRSQVVNRHIQNVIGNILEYSGGNKPDVIVPSAVNPELFNYLENLFNKAYNLIGVSILSSQSMKPSGLDSGVAIRTADDIETERFSEISLDYQDWFLEIAEDIINLAREIEDFSASVKSGNVFNDVKWSEINLANEDFKVDLYPVNLLSSKPEGKLAQVQEMVSANLISPEEGKDLLDFPDLDRYQDLDSANRDIIRKTVDQMVRKGIYTPPEPFDDLTFALKYAKQAYGLGRLEGAPEDNLELCRNYILEVINELKKLQPPTPTE